MPQQYKSAKRKMKKPAMSHGNKPKMYGEPKMKIGKLKKQKTQDIKVSRGITMGINLGGGKALVGLDLSGHKKKSNKPNPYQKSLDKGKKKPNAKFPDLSGDGKVTKKDILIGRGVIDKPKMLKNKRKDIAGKAMMAYAKPAMYGDKPKMYGDKPKGYVSDAQRKAVHASKADGGEGNPNKPKKIYKAVSGPHGTGKHYHMTRVNTKKGKVTHKDVSKKKAERISKRNFKKAMKEAEKNPIALPKMYGKKK